MSRYARYRTYDKSSEHQRQTTINYPVKADGQSVIPVVGLISSVTRITRNKLISVPATAGSTQETMIGG
jgi:hypothetical protein